MSGATDPSRRGTTPWEPFAQALAALYAKEGVYCQIIATDGDEPRHNGGCPHWQYGVKWEDGFVDRVCLKHGHGAEERGALVVWTRDRDVSPPASSPTSE